MLGLERHTAVGQNAAEIFLFIRHGYFPWRERNQLVIRRTRAPAYLNSPIGRHIAANGRILKCRRLSAAEARKKFRTVQSVDCAACRLTSRFNFPPPSATRHLWPNPPDGALLYSVSISADSRLFIAAI